jgi:hypothetical protein
LLSTTVMRLGPTVHRISDWFFVKTIRSAAAKQVAGEVFHSTKVAQEEAAKATSPSTTQDQPNGQTSN